MRIVLVVNPFASKVTDSGLAAVEAALARAGSVETRRTERRGHATELARASAGADAVVVFGGDGAVNEVLNGLPPDTPFGAVPGGGTSVFARALGLPGEPGAAARTIADALVSGRRRRISVGAVNGRRFGFACGLGFDAEAVRRIDALGRSAAGRRPGDLRFAWTLVRVVLEARARFEPVLEVEGLGRAAFALVANCDPYTYAGRVALHVAPEARFELGLDLVAPRRLAPRDVPRIVGHLLRGHGQERDAGILYAHDVDRIEIACDRPIPLQADGEDLGDVERAVFEAVRDAVVVVA